MGTIATAFSTAFRDYNTDGVASSGVKQPAKSEIRSIGTTIEAYFAAPWTLSANTTVTTPPSAPTGYIQQLIGASANANQFFLLDGSGGIPGFRTRRWNVTGSAASAIQSGDVLSTWDVYGFGSTSVSSGARAQIRVVATQTWTDTAHGSKIVIATTANGGTTLTDRVTIDQDGSVTFSGVLNASAEFNAAAGIRNTGIQYATNATGTSLSLALATPICIHENAATATTIAALTVVFPASPTNGSRLLIVSVGGVTTTTWNGSGATVVGSATLAANVAQEYIYVSSTSKWYRIR